MARPRRITTEKDELLPEWLRYLAPGGSTGRSLAGKPCYQAWRKAVFSVFDNDEYWGTRVDTSPPVPPHVSAELRAIRERIEADAGRVRGATSGETSADSYYSKMMMALVGRALYDRIVEKEDDNPYSEEAAKAFGEIYGNKLLALTWKASIVAL